MSASADQASNMLIILFLITLAYFFVMVIGSIFGYDLSPMCLLGRSCFGGSP